MLLVVVWLLPLCVYSQTSPSVLAQNCPPKDQSALLPDVPLSGNANTDLTRTDAQINAIDALINGLRNNSFPELAHVDLGVRPFHSESDYFRTRFSLSRFVLLRRMQYYVEVNPALFQRQAPFAGVCAILAHELSHVVSLSRGNRIRRFGLVRLFSHRYTAKFERRTDLEAIHRGYGDDLKSYRVWVYAHVPPNNLPAKRRNYFSPDEIAAIRIKLQDHPGLFAYWTKHVPENLSQIEKSLR
jgi:hypothetical protein